jgi:hypothetical protein
VAKQNLRQAGTDLRAWLFIIRSAVVGSSASNTAGLHDSASAIIAPCRIPPGSATVLGLW